MVFPSEMVPKVKYFYTVKYSGTTIFIVNFDRDLGGYFLGIKIGFSNKGTLILFKNAQKINVFCVQRKDLNQKTTRALDKLGLPTVQKKLA